MRIISLILLLAACASCGKQAPKTSSEQVLRLNLSDDPVALDPRVVRSLKDLTVVKQLFEGLMRLDAQGIPQLALAQSVDISEDLLTYTFHLREAQWSNGDPVTAQDLRYAWMTALDPSFACDYSYMLYPIKNAQKVRQGLCTPEELGVSVVDDKTLVVELQIPTPYFLELTAFPTLFPVHHKIAVTYPLWSSPASDHFVCNGPFCLGGWATQAEISLTKNPTYWDQQSVSLDRITFSVISDNNTECQLFETNELDWLGQPISNSIAPELLGKMKLEGKLASYDIAGTLWFKFNTAKDPFDNLNIRKAFSYAVNRADIITHILQGNQTAATGPLPPCMAVNTAPYFTDGDTTTAQSLFEKGLAEKGLTRETFPTVVLTYAPNERTNKIVQLVQQQWYKALGVKIELQALERQVYERNAKRGLYQVGVGQWIADFNDPLAFLEIFKFKIDPEVATGMNDTGWQDATYISLLDASLSERDPQARQALLRQAETILMEAMPIAPLYHYAFDYVKKPYVQDVVLSPLGIADFKTTHLAR
ncbi:peptide ABC transporter substrate-binding protein [Chlamydiota bacterium]